MQLIPSRWNVPGNNLLGGLFALYEFRSLCHGVRFHLFFSCTLRWWWIVNSRLQKKHAIPPVLSLKSLMLLLLSKGRMRKLYYIYLRFSFHSSIRTYSLLSVLWSLDSLPPTMLLLYVLSSHRAYSTVHDLPLFKCFGMQNIIMRFSYNFHRRYSVRGFILFFFC